MTKVDDVVSNILAHHGIKGMRWGVRNSDPSSQVKQKTADLGVVKLKNGDTMQLSGDRTGAMAKFLSKLSPSVRESINASSSFTIKDSAGKAVGEMALYKKGPKELNVVWVGVKDSARGNGYASGAMRAAIDEAKRQKMEKVTLEVPGKSPDARHIYEKLGFKENKHQTPGIQEDDPLWGGLTEMTLDLKGK